MSFNESRGIKSEPFQSKLRHKTSHKVDEARDNTCTDESDVHCPNVILHNSFIASQAPVEELYQSIQILESNKKDLIDTVNFYREQHEQLKSKLSASKRRIEMQERSIEKLSQAFGRLQQEKLVPMAEEEQVLLHGGNTKLEQHDIFEDLRLENQSLKKELKMYQEKQPQTVQTERVNEDSAQSFSSQGWNSLHTIEMEKRVEQFENAIARLQMEKIQTQRFESLRKVILIRRFLSNRALAYGFGAWKLQYYLEVAVRLSACQQLWRTLCGIRTQRLRFGMSQWKCNAQLIYAYSVHHQALSCWNKMLAAQRLYQFLDKYTFKRKSTYFQILCRTATSNTDREPTKPLKEEIEKLHAQLSRAKSEAYKYKRQALQQLL